MLDNQEALFPLHARAAVSTTKKLWNLDKEPSGNREKCGKFFQPAQVRLTPAAAEIQFHRGVALFQLQHLQAATACFRKATQLKPDYDIAYYNLGRCLHRQGNRAGAIEAFRAALRCEPNLAEARTALAEQLFNGVSW